MILRSYIQISQEKAKKKCLLGMCYVGLFCKNLARYHSIHFRKLL